MGWRGASALSVPVCARAADPPHSPRAVSSTQAPRLAKRGRPRAAQQRAEHGKDRAEPPGIHGPPRQRPRPAAVCLLEAHVAHAATSLLRLLRCKELITKLPYQKLLRWVHTSVVGLVTKNVALRAQTRNSHYYVWKSRGPRQHLQRKNSLDTCIVVWFHFRYAWLTP